MEIIHKKIPKLLIVFALVVGLLMPNVPFRARAEEYLHVIDSVTYDLDTAVVHQNYHGMEYYIFDDGMMIIEGAMPSDINAEGILKQYDSQVTKIYMNMRLTGENATYFFRDMKNVKKIEFGDNFSTKGITDTRHMFHGCRSLQSLDFSRFDMSAVTSADYMFSDCRSLGSADISSWDLSSCRSLYYFFDWCQALSEVKVGKKSFRKEVDLQGMFADCKRLKSVDLSGFELSNVSNMAVMFFYCDELEGITFKEGEKAKELKTIEGMFYGCDSLKKLNLSFVPDSLSEIGSFITGCDSLETLILPASFGKNIKNKMELSAHQSYQYLTVLNEEMEVMVDKTGGEEIMNARLPYETTYTYRACDEVYPYVVFLESDHGFVPSTIYCLPGEKLMGIDRFKASGYRLEGWYRDPDFQNKWDLEKDVVNRTTYLYAKWVEEIIPEPTPSPTPAPTVSPTPAPTVSPTPEPTSSPTPAPTVSPTASPTISPTPAPTPESTPAPTVSPTASPTISPTPAPTPEPTPEPTASPTASPTPAPTASPTPEPTASPTVRPTPAPTASPTASPTIRPTPAPTVRPTPAPTVSPTAIPTLSPTPAPTVSPTPSPTVSPTPEPTLSPTPEPTASPTAIPTLSPTSSPTPAPTVSPTPEPTASPTLSPTPAPTASPTSSPTVSTTPNPTPEPTPSPEPTPTPNPTPEPKPSPTPEPKPSPEPSPTPNPTEPPVKTEEPLLTEQWGTGGSVGKPAEAPLEKSRLKINIVYKNKKGEYKPCVKLSWSSVSGAVKYVIYKSYDGKKYKVYKTITSVKKLQYMDEKVRKGKTVFYKVQALTGSEAGGDSKSGMSKAVKHKFSRKLICPVISTKQKGDSFVICLNRIEGNGYQMQYRYLSPGKRWVDFKAFSGKLKKKLRTRIQKTGFQIRIRTYRKTGRKRQYSKWSKIITVRK